MAARPSWKTFIRLSLVSIPVKGYTAHATAKELPLHQIHASCHSRIRYKKVCPIHGEVPKDEIVSGYEFSKNRYVEIDPAHLEKLRGDKDRAISIETFAPPDAVDPVYYNGQTYYLLPDGPAGEKPYVLLQQGMVDQNKYALALTVLHNKEQLVLLRPFGRLIAMELLHFQDEVKAADAFKSAIPSKAPSHQEAALVSTLIKTSTAKRIDLAKYKDHYRERLRKFIEAKVEGKEIVSPQAAEEPHVINLMDALKKSLEMQGTANGGSKKPPRKMAKTIRKTVAKSKRKTG